VTDGKWGLFIGGQWRQAARGFEVRNPLDDELVDVVSDASDEDVRDAVGAATTSLSIDFPAHARYDVLTRAADRVFAHREEYATAIAREGSKHIREARREPVRSATLLRLCADEARRLAGETLPFDLRPGSERRVGYWYRVPVGVVGAIAPFNDPLAVALHKAGPALAAGNAVVLKPSPSTPLSALRLARDLDAAGLPPGRLNVVTGVAPRLGEAIVTDPRVRVVTFAGGVDTGRRITQVAGVKKVLLELGSNSPVIVMADADLDRAVPAIVDGAYAQAGQNCLGVQRVYVHDALYDRFRARFVDAVKRLRAGHSMDERTDVCSIITLAHAERIEAWVDEAVQRGARLLAGGGRKGTLYEPTVLEDVPAEARYSRDEIYGPVAALARVASLAEAIERANGVDYGLHAAIFTESLRDAFTAVRDLRAGGVIVNDSTDYRLDVMPFGGTKLSGIGREGVQFAVQEMTEPKVVCFNL
jgi:glyceraldehyde-3-phosphate dehydrogenase (NADP+)